ncbi:MAG: chromosomal replication initiator protein DnaA [Planctomycetota bacterium]|nr:MAG: chromosomal replication initiator protein DnaA [Planctomycetota bacterium]
MSLAESQAPLGSGDQPAQDADQDPLRAYLRGLVSPRKFELWFSTIQIVDSTSDPVIVSLGNDFLCEWVARNYLDEVHEGVAECLGQPRRVEFSVDSLARPAPPQPQRDSGERNRDYFISNSDVGLNPRYTFDNFIVGPSNQLAHAASAAVAEALAGSYNPLFVHGSVGLGKTHLLQAICHKAMASKRSLKVLYLSSETFVNQFIASIEKGDLERFRYRYRNVDMLVVDDIQLLAHKERTQEEFFHTFNALHNAERQIVLASDSPPDEIPTLRERLSSRFKWGLVAQVAPPRFETRQAILRRKALDRGAELPPEVLNFLAENIDSNIRELEGAVTKVLGYAQLIGGSIDVGMARDALGTSASSSATRAVTGVERIQEVVCEHFGVKISDLQGRRRTQSIALPRQVAMALARRLTALSLEEIGGRFGGRDHSTVLYAVSRMKDRAERDPSFRSLLTELQDKAQR